MKILGSNTKCVKVGDTLSLKFKITTTNVLKLPPETRFNLLIEPTMFWKKDAPVPIERWSDSNDYSSIYVEEEFCVKILKFFNGIG